jgi:hypothetical protein
VFECVRVRVRVRVREQKRFREEGEPRLFCFSPSLFLMCCFSCPIAERETPSFPRETNSLLSCHEGLLAFAHSHSTHTLTPIQTLTQTNTLTRSLIHKDARSLTHSFTKTLTHPPIHPHSLASTHSHTSPRVAPSSTDLSYNGKTTLSHIHAERQPGITRNSVFDPRDHIWLATRSCCV